MDDWRVQFINSSPVSLFLVKLRPSLIEMNFIESDRTLFWLNICTKDFKTTTSKCSNGGDPLRNHLALNQVIQKTPVDKFPPYMIAGNGIEIWFNSFSLIYRGTLLA